ncbi:MAG: molybdopterin synthase sulfur carrier subunit [Brachybacterium faecium]|nr:MAG: molybdopterin synthase sulfur carrier subunit [Brachybacterium faecium]
MTTPTTPAPSETRTTATGATEAATITVRLFAGAAAAYGSDTATVRGATVAEAIRDLTAGAPADATTAIERSSLLVNAVACTDHSRVLADGDRIDVLPPFAGG